MSSIRTGGLFEFHNAGPLTTTWTAPTSCPKLAVDMYIKGIEDPDDPGELIVGLSACSDYQHRRNCTPHGEAVAEYYSKINSETPFNSNTIFPRRRRENFYSPGLACPSAWDTVGVISSKDGSLDPSGVFESTVFPTYGGYVRELPSRDFALNALTSVLEPSETAIVCCPSGFTGHVLHGCYFTIDMAEVAGKTGCVNDARHNMDETSTLVAFEYFGTTITQEIYDWVRPTSASLSMSTGQKTFTIDASGRTNSEDIYFPYETGEPVVAIERAAPFYLINGGGEGGNVTTEDGSDDVADGKAQGGESDDEREENVNGNNNESAARSLGSLSVVGALAAAWGLGLAAVCIL